MHTTRKCFRGLSLRLSVQASETCSDLHSLSPTWMPSMLSYVLGKKYRGQTMLAFPNFCLIFLSSSPHQKHDHILAEYFPVQEKEKIKRPALSIHIGWEKKKKKTQTFYLDLVHANTHWFQGDFNCFRTKLKTQWKSVFGHLFVPTTLIPFIQLLEQNACHQSSIL